MYVLLLAGLKFYRSLVGEVLGGFLTGRKFYGGKGREREGGDTRWWDCRGLVAAASAI